MRRAVAYLCVLLVLCGSCDDHLISPENKPNLRTLSAAEESVSAANNDFAFDFFRKVRQGAENKNIFVSPLSVTMGLSMAMNGANDSTQQSILRLLKFGNTTPAEVNQACKDLTSLLTSMDRTVQVGLANSVWSNQDYTIQKSFADIIAQYYDGKVQALDFTNPSSVNTINSWVESKTNHLIKNLLDHIDSNAVMFLINAIYFKGTWTDSFDNSQTRLMPFFAEDGSVQNVTTMHSRKSKVAYFQHRNFTLIDIPYGNEQFSMTILIPTEGSTLNNLLSVTAIDSLDLWLSHSASITAPLEMPKFKMSWQKELLDDLEEMGMKKNGFPHLFEEQLPLEITSVIHQSYIDVNEQGTEAAAATSVTIGVTSIGPPSILKVNRPFIYLIREKHTDAILFMGQLISPGTD